MAFGDIVLENQNAQQQIDDYVNSLDYSKNQEIAYIQKTLVLGGLVDLKKKNQNQALAFDEQTKREIDQVFTEINKEKDGRIDWIKTTTGEYRNQILNEVRTNGISRIENSGDIFAENNSRNTIVRNIDKYSGAAFGTKVDSSLFDFEYDGDLSVKLREAHNVADKIEIEETELFSAQDIQNITLSCFVKDEWLKEFGVQDPDCPEELREQDILENGIMLLYENFIKGDKRTNVQELRVNLPKARELAKSAINNFTSGENKKELADIMKHGFTSLLRSSKTYGSYYEAKTIFTKKHLVEIYDKLNTEAFKDLVTFTEEEKRFAELSRKEAEFTNRYNQLRNEVAEEMERHIFGNEESIIENGKIKNDALEEKFTELYAIERYFAAKEMYVKDSRDLNTSKYSRYAANNILKERGIAEFEDEFLKDPEGYVEQQKKFILKDKDKLPYPSNASNYRELLNSFRDVLCGTTTVIQKLNLPVDDYLYKDKLNITFKKKITESYNEAKTISSNPPKAMEYLKKLSEMEELKPEATLEEVNERLSLLREADEYFDDDSIVVDALYTDPDDPEDREINHISTNIVAYIETAITGIEKGLATEDRIREIKANEANKEIKETLKDEYVDVSEKVDEEAVKEAERKFNERTLFGRLTKDGAKEFLKEDLEEFKNLCNEINDPVLTNLYKNIDKAVNSEELDELAGQLYNGASGYVNVLNEKMLSSDDPKYVKAMSAVNKIANSLSAYDEARTLNGASKEEVEEKYSKAFTYADTRIDEISKDIKNIEARFKDNPEGLKKDKSYEIAKKALDCMDHIKECIVGDAFGDPKNNLKALTNSNDLLVVGMHELCKGENSKLVNKVDNSFLKKLAKDPYVVKNRKELDIDKLEKSLKNKEGAVEFINDPNKGKVKESSSKDKNKNLEQENVIGLN